MRNDSCRFADDHIDRWGCTDEFARSKTLKIDGIPVQVSSHTFDFTISLDQTPIGILKKTDIYGPRFANSMHAHTVVTVRDRKKQLRRLIMMSPGHYQVHHLTLTLILALRTAGLWLLDLNALQALAPLLPGLRTATVTMIPSPEPCYRAFYRTNKYGELSDNEIKGAAYPAVLDLGRALFRGQVVACEVVGWDRGSYVLDLSTGTETV